MILRSGKVKAAFPTWEMRTLSSDYKPAQRQLELTVGKALKFRFLMIHRWEQSIKLSCGKELFVYVINKETSQFCMHVILVLLSIRKLFYQSAVTWGGGEKGTMKIGFYTPNNDYGMVHVEKTEYMHGNRGRENVLLPSVAMNVGVPFLHHCCHALTDSAKTPSFISWKVIH